MYISIKDYPIKEMIFLTSCSILSKRFLFGEFNKNYAVISHLPTTHYDIGSMVLQTAPRKLINMHLASTPALYDDMVMSAATPLNYSKTYRRTVCLNRYSYM